MAGVTHARRRLHETQLRDGSVTPHRGTGSRAPVEYPNETTGESINDDGDGRRWPPCCYYFVCAGCWRAPSARRSQVLSSEDAHDPAGARRV